MTWNSRQASSNKSNFCPKWKSTRRLENGALHNGKLNKHITTKSRIREYGSSATEKCYFIEIEGIRLNWEGKRICNLGKLTKTGWFSETNFMWENVDFVKQTRVAFDKDYGNWWQDSRNDKKLCVYTWLNGEISSDWTTVMLDQFYGFCNEWPENNKILNVAFHQA